MTKIYTFKIMVSFTYIILFAVISLATANPAVKSTFWRDTPLDNMVEEMRSNCDSGLDSMACIKVKVLNFLDTIVKKDNYQISDDVEVRSNGYTSDSNGRSEQVGFLENVEQYLQSHDVTFKLPIAGAQVTVSPKNLNNDELNLNFKFPGTVTEARKSKLKKIAIPIMVFVLLKAMTLIPLALGVLGLKAWNSLQLGFLSFMVSVGLAIFQLCKKLALDHHHHPAHIAAHGPWDGRTYSAEPAPQYDAHNLAYNAYESK